MTTVIVAFVGIVAGGINNRIDDVNANVNNRIDDLNDSVNNRFNDVNHRIDDMNRRIDDLQNDMREVRAPLDRRAEGRRTRRELTRPADINPNADSPAGAEPPSRSPSHHDTSASAARATAPSRRPPDGPGDGASTPERSTEEPTAGDCDSPDCGTAAPRRSLQPTSASTTRETLPARSLRRFTAAAAPAGSGGAFFPSHGRGRTTPTDSASHTGSAAPTGPATRRPPGDTPAGTDGDGTASESASTTHRPASQS